MVNSRLQIMKRLILVWTFCFCAKTFSTAATAPAWPHEGSDLRPDQAVTWGSLENGFRYALLPNAEPPGRITLRLWVGSGSLQEADDQQGLAHFLEHMAFNGTKHVAAGEMVEYFQRLGRSVGPDVNAHTSFEETVYKLDLPGNSPELLRDGLRLLRDYADRMLFEPEELDKERGIILNEMRLRDSVDYRTTKAAVAFAWPESRIPERGPIGTEEVIKTAPRERFLDFDRTWYRPERTVLVAVGAVDGEDLAAAIREHFGDWQAGDVKAEPPMGEVIARAGQARLHTEAEASATYVTLQRVRPHDASPDSVEKRTREARWRT